MAKGLENMKVDTNIKSSVAYAKTGTPPLNSLLSPSRDGPLGIEADFPLHNCACAFALGVVAFALGVVVEGWTLLQI